MRKIQKITAVILICLTITPAIESKAAVDLASEYEMYHESLNYLAQCVQAEAGNQDYLGKVYVVDCILNRYDSGDYNNFYDVINEPGQFSCVANESIKCKPSPDIYKIIADELGYRTNSEIKFFRTKEYHKFATDCFKYGAHYFSK